MVSEKAREILESMSGDMALIELVWPILKERLEVKNAHGTITPEDVTTLLEISNKLIFAVKKAHEALQEAYSN